jgi:uncharacterized membrane protein
MTTSNSEYARVTMTVLAVAVALFSLRFYGVLFHDWLQIDQGIRGVILLAPLPALTHMLVAPVALLLGPFQFSAGLRTKYPRFHRVSGRIYVAACVVSGFAALATAPYASGGGIAGLGFGILGLSWLAATLGAWRAAVRRDFSTHRLLMRFSYAMTFAAVTLRLQIPIGFALGFASYSAMSVWLAYTAWIPNVIAVAIYSIVETSVRSTRSRSATPSETV